ncbi:hypothetical protein HELRODRAFT_92475, partial [Helobdella robusta]|uniref:Cyclin C-terminal domain-containing protein n=1 Tax=Helobdella robusta TaxID=6412 RepID=T1G8G9_HELRO
EMFLIQSLNWDVIITTAYDFIDVMLHRLPVNVCYHSLVSRHAQTFVSLCATEHYFLMYPPSVLAAATLLASITGLIGQLPANKEEVEKTLHCITQIDIVSFDCIKACQEQIELLCSHNISSQFLIEEPQSPPPQPPPPPITPPNYAMKSSSSHIKVHHSDQPITSSSTPTDVTDVQLD